MHDIEEGILTLAEHLRANRDSILREWQRAVKRDPGLTQGDALPQAELYDHIPAVLSAFEHCLRQRPTSEPPADAAEQPAVKHGLQRWQQGYDLREILREMGLLNKCVIQELDRYGKAHPHTSIDAMARAREVWTTLCSNTIEVSAAEYFALQQREAAGHIEELERALQHIHDLEQERGDLWREAAHDLRGNLGVVAHVAVGLTRHGQRDESREDFVRILTRNVTSLHHLLNDVTSLARLQAGREKRDIEPIDVTTILEPLGEGIRPLAEQRGLYLRYEGPVGLAVDGDAVKIRRIAQNLVLNAVKYTRQGGITLTWGDSGPKDTKRWLLTVQNTGPGLPTKSSRPVTAALEPTGDARSSVAANAQPAPSALSSEQSHSAGSLSREAGEGIGLSIVKRLCEMLNAKIEVQSVKDQGTTFRVLFPRYYAPEAHQ